MKLLSILLSAVAVQAIALPAPQDDAAPTDKKCLLVGKVCDGLAGPVGTCCPGTFCYQKYPDYFVCTKRNPDDTPGHKCLKPGALCAGVAGTVGICCPGSTCVQRWPDYATCSKPKPSYSTPYGDENDNEKDA